MDCIGATYSSKREFTSLPYFVPSTLGIFCMLKSCVRILIPFLFFILISLFSQAQYSGNYAYYREFEDIIKVYDSKNLHKAILMMNDFLAKYPNSGAMYFNRGLAKGLLNDIQGAKEDYLLCKNVGHEKQEEFIKWFTDDEYRVRVLAQGYIDQPEILKAENNFKTPYTLSDTLHGSLRPERTCFDVSFYDLRLKVLPKTKSIEGRVIIEFVVIDSTDRIQIDLANQLAVLSIQFEGNEIDFERVHNAMFLNLGRKLAPESKHRITVSYEGNPQVAKSAPWNGGFVWKKNRGKNWIGVACEHLGASSWWPCKDHLSDKPDSMAITIVAPAKHQAIANGNLRSVESEEDKFNAFNWFVSYPINSYNVTFYIGDFTTLNEKYTNGAINYDVDYYVLSHNEKRAKSYYSQTATVLKTFEKLFGEYPYKRDGVGMVEAPYSGMEHQSAIAIGDDYGKKQRRLYQNQKYDYLLVHETAHEWWGNTVAMRDMADAWISEGFATYSEHLFLEQQFGMDEYLDAVRKNMTQIENIWPVVGNRNVNDNTFLGGDIYNKGAATLHSFRCLVNNDSLFLRFIRDFYQDNKYTTITTPEFINYTNQYFQKNYTHFFKKYLYDTEPPVLHYRYDRTMDSLEFTFWFENVGASFELPFILNVDGQESYRFVGKVKQQTVKLPGTEIFFPNENFLNDLTRVNNSLTYHWTKWELVYEK